MTTSNNIGIIIVEKTGILKELVVKEYNEGELFKKCGFKRVMILRNKPSGLSR